MVEDFRLATASLEDVYVELVGRSLDESVSGEADLSNQEHVGAESALR